MEPAQGSPLESDWRVYSGYLKEVGFARYLTYCMPASHHKVRSNLRTYACNVSYTCMHTFVPIVLVAASTLHVRTYSSYTAIYNDLCRLETRVLAILQAILYRLHCMYVLIALQAMHYYLQNLQGKYSYMHIRNYVGTY